MNVRVRNPLGRLHRSRSRVAHCLGITPFALGFALLAAGCSSREAEDEAKMTSYSTGENKNDTADLFSIPQDQMAHVQVVTVEKSKVAAHTTSDRRRRLQRFQNDARLHRRRRPGSGNLAQPGAKRSRRPNAAHSH